jgi:hypothetical protein
MRSLDPEGNVIPLGFDRLIAALPACIDARRSFGRFTTAAPASRFHRLDWGRTPGLPTGLRVHVGSVVLLGFNRSVAALPARLEARQARDRVFDLPDDREGSVVLLGFDRRIAYRAAGTLRGPNSQKRNIGRLAGRAPAIPTGDAMDGRRMPEIMQTRLIAGAAVPLDAGNLTQATECFGNYRIFQVLAEQQVFAVSRMPAAVLRDECLQGQALVGGGSYVGAERPGRGDTLHAYEAHQKDVPLADRRSRPPSTRAQR